MRQTARMIGHILTTTEDLEAGADALAAIEPRFGLARAAAGPLPLRRRPDGFAALRDAIIGQQVSVASARAIRGRLEEAGFVCCSSVAAAGDEALRACGLSRQKIRYLTALAQAGIDFDALRALPNEDVVARLIPLPGIGRWACEMYLMFALGRADVFAPDDLALAESARVLFELPERPRPRAFATMAEAWSPWRSVAAQILWAYYHIAKGREGTL